MQLITQIVIPHYIKQIQVSKHRRPTYYKMGEKKIPKKYDNFPFEKFGGTMMLCNPGTKTRVIKNSKSVGTPRYLAINGQKFYSGFNSEHERMTIVYGLKDYYDEIIIGMKPITEFPIFIKYIHFAKTEIGFSIADLDNLSYCYTKTFQDWLTSRGIISEDNTRYIRSFQPEVFPVETDEERKLIILIYKYDPNITLTELKKLKLI